MPIQVLPESLVNKIAAGEVIVRPASVVKELVENAIDAGATRITVEIANGARDLRIIDDGCGMDRADAQLALVRHATSKITSFDDLYALHTRGFRGEALASIAAVSRLQILTRKKDNVAGTRVVAEGAGEPRVEPAGAPEGTDIRVRDLFFNTPARLKFMKSATSEMQQVLQTVTRQALIRPDLGFTVTNEKSTMIEVPPAQAWDERVAALLGSQLNGQMLEVDSERHGLRIRGFVVKPTVTRKDRTHQFFFVNGRPVSSRSLSFVLQQAYQGIIMTQRFPVCVLEIVVPEGDVDVNVHPTKEEVRFQNESLINGSIFKAVNERLVAANLVPAMTLDAEAGGADSGAISIPPPPVQTELLGAVSAQSYDTRTPQIPVDFSSYTFAAPRPAGAPADAMTFLQRSAAGVATAEREFQHVENHLRTEAATAPTPAAEADDPDHSCSVRPLSLSVKQVGEASPDPAAHALLKNGMYPEPLGQVATCYIIAQTGEDLLLIDQHAAHERLLYMQFSDVNRHIQTQALLIPVSVDVPAAAVPFMHRLLPVLERVGLKMEAFGGQTFLVQSVPADVRHFDPAAVISDLLDEFESLGKIEQIEILHDRIITRMACRAAIKAGQQLHREEMRALVRDIINSRLGFTCPHGRPTMIMLTRDQLDRQFKRKA